MNTNPQELREDEDPLNVGKADMQGMIHVEGIAGAAAKVATAWAPPFDLNAEARLAGMILAAYEAGMVQGMTMKPDRVF